jgi:hypothetical protein
MARGRKTKLTPEIQKTILDIIRAGNYAKVACEAAGINSDTYYEWLNRGKKDKEAGKRTIFSDFSEEIMRSAAIAEAANVARIRQAADAGTWQAAAWFLERKYGDRWGRNDKLRQEITGANGAPIEIDAREAVLEFLRRRNEESAD